MSEISFEKKPTEEVDPFNLMRDMFRRFTELRDLESDRMRDPSWHYERVYIMSPELFELRHASDTPPEVKQRIDSETFAGWQWVKRGERND